jgi:peptide/nickel transport system permease protein
MSNAYLTYATKRLVQAVVVILLAYVFTFVVVSILPGDPITNVLRDPQNGFTEKQIREIIAAQGLDQPIVVQLWTSLSNFLTGELGLSMRSNRPVTTLIAEVLPSTLVLASAGFAVALLLAVVIGYGTQFVPKRFGQGLLRGLPSLSLSVPNFVIGLVLIHLFGFQLGLFRVIEPDSFWATLFAAIALGIPVSAQIAEVLIANLDHESRQEYAAVARGRGLGQVRLVVSLAAVVFVLVNLIADLVYPLLDPRVKLIGGHPHRPSAADENSAGVSKVVTS